jgi:diacylglycerol kinase family enzyme
MTFSHITIIYNPNSTGPSRAMAERLAAKLTAAGPGAYAPEQVELVATAHAGHAEELAEAAARAHQRPLIVSSSGDGGYHEVINGVMTAVRSGHPAVAAVLPAGNANDHRRTLARAPLGDSILAGRTTRIDLLEVDIAAPDQRSLRYAHSYAGLGLTPVVAAELNRHTLNALRELLIVVRTFAKLQPVTLCDAAGRTIRLDSLILSNINQMAKTLTISHTGRPTDGRFEVTAFPAGSKWRLLMRLLRAAVSKLPANARVTEYSFTVVKHAPMQLDGEVTELPAGTRITVKIAPAALETVL